jgi:MFS family permease
MTGWPVRSLALLVAGTLFMQNLDGTIVATAAPSMARSFHVGSAQIGICVTAYLVTVAALIPVSAWVADNWGARRRYSAP